MTTTLAPAWYIIRSTRLWARLLNLLHWPYTAWHLSYVVIGAALAPATNFALLGWTLLAFFLGMGVAAHATDLLHGDPLKLAFSKPFLWALVLVTLSLASLIGIWQVLSLHLAPWLLLLIVIGGALAIGYGLEITSFHGDIRFGLFWGAFPFVTGYLAQTQVFSWTLVAGAAFCLFTALAQRVLSTRVRFLRRKVASVDLALHFNPSNPFNTDPDVSNETASQASQRMDRKWLIEADERTLALLALAFPVLAILMLIS